jgi:hypothetical protein
VGLARDFVTFTVLGTEATFCAGAAGFPPDFATFTLLADDAAALFTAVLRLGGVPATSPGSGGAAGNEPTPVVPFRARCLFGGALVAATFGAATTDAIAFDALTFGFAGSGGVA